MLPAGRRPKLFAKTELTVLNFRCHKRGKLISIVQTYLVAMTGNASLIGAGAPSYFFAGSFQYQVVLGKQNGIEKFPLNTIVLRKDHSYSHHCPRDSVAFLQLTQRS